jgi:hypothetical protein
MAKFVKENFNYDGMYLSYQGEFVARFKRGGMATFRNFLVKNFDVNEYFNARLTDSPLPILEAKGYVTPSMKKSLIRMGYEPTQAGKTAYINSLIAERK